MAPMETPSIAPIATRASEQQIELIDRACELDGKRSRSSLILSSVITEARRIVADKDPDFLRRWEMSQSSA